MRNFLVTAAFAAFACTPVVQAVIITYCNEQKIREAVANSSATFGIGRRSKKAILCLTPGKAVTSSPAIPYSWAGKANGIGRLPASSERKIVMNSVLTKILGQKVGVGLSSMLAIAAVILAPAEVLRADDRPVPVLTQFSISGFQADSSSPLVLNGDLVGTGAIWKHIDGPVLGTTVGMTSSPPGGVVFQVEYSQDQIVTQDGSTITVNLYGIRSTPYGSAGGHITNGAYDIVGGTGRFEGIIGTGTVTIDVRADGSVRFILGGGEFIGQAVPPRE